MFRFTCLSLSTLAVISVLWGTPARASSILIDQGSTTYDPTTHLQWLDLTATMGNSYDGVMANINGNYIKDGWRYATDVEVSRLYHDAGISLSTNPDGTFHLTSDPTQPGYAALEHDTFVLGSELGWGGPPSDDYLVFGLYSVPATSEHPSALGFMGLSVAGYLLNGPGSQVYIDGRWDIIGPDQAIRDDGSLLVREVSAVPVPGEAIPMGALLLGFTGFNLWRKKQQSSSQA